MSDEKKQPEIQEQETHNLADDGPKIAASTHDDSFQLPQRNNTKQIVEAILFAAHKTMTVRQIQQVFPELERPDSLAIQDAIDAIMQDYQHRPVGLKLLASGYRFQVKEGLSSWISRLYEEKPPKYSRALLETLAVIAYRQPVTRGEIEDIRGVSVSSNIMRTLLEREWVRIIAHKEVPGRPALYGTTKHLLDYFNLSSLDELPSLEEIENLNNTEPEPEISQQTSEEQTTTSPTEPEIELSSFAEEEITAAASEANKTIH